MSGEAADAREAAGHVVSEEWIIVYHMIQADFLISLLLD